MDYTTAEEKFHELHARIQRGEALSEEQYQEELAKLMVQDDNGTFWSLEPGTGRWLYFDGTEWLPGTPPRQEMAAPQEPSPAAEPDLRYAPPAETYAPGESYSPAETYGSAESYASAETYGSAESYSPGEAYSPPQSYSPSESYAPDEPYAAGEPSTQQPAQPYSYTPSYTSPPSYIGGSMPSESRPLEPDMMPTYVRVPETEPMLSGTGGIPPRPVRDASPLAVPGMERPWLPFAFGAIVLLMCAVVLFFGVRGLPAIIGGGQAAQPTTEPTEDVAEIVPTSTREIQPTRIPTRPSRTPEPTPTEAPQEVFATTTDVLNVRRGPATTFAIIAKLPADTTVTVVGRNEDSSWLQIRVPDKEDLGWVSAQFTTVEGDLDALPVSDGEPTGSAPRATDTPVG